MLDAIMYVATNVKTIHISLFSIDVHRTSFVANTAPAFPKIRPAMRASLAHNFNATRTSAYRQKKYATPRTTVRTARTSTTAFVSRSHVPKERIDVNMADAYD